MRLSAQHAAHSTCTCSTCLGRCSKLCGRVPCNEPSDCRWNGSAWCWCRRSRHEVDSMVGCVPLKMKFNWVPLIMKFNWV